MKRLKAKLTALALTSFLMACVSQRPKTLLKSDFCDVYKPLPPVRNEKLVEYWESTETEVLDKISKNVALKPSELFFAKFVANVAQNEERYKLKKCNEH